MVMRNPISGYSSGDKVCISFLCQLILEVLFVGFLSLNCVFICFSLVPQNNCTCKKKGTISSGVLAGMQSKIPPSGMLTRGPNKQNREKQPPKEGQKSTWRKCKSTTPLLSKHRRRQPQKGHRPLQHGSIPEKNATTDSPGLQRPMVARQRRKLAPDSGSQDLFTERLMQLQVQSREYYDQI